MTDRLLYSDDQIVWVRSWHLRQSGGEPLSAGRARYRLVDPDGRVVEDLRVEVLDGFAHNGLVLHWGAVPGPWAVEVEDEDGVVARQVVWVRRWEGPPWTGWRDDPGLRVVAQREGDHLILDVEAEAGADLALSVVEAPQVPEPEPPWEFWGHFDRSNSWMDEAIRERVPRVRRCYEVALRTDPGLSGKVVVGMEMDSTATLEWLRIEESTLAHEDVERCILEALATTDFGGRTLHHAAHIRYPYLLRPEEGDDLHPGPGYEGELRVEGPPYSRVRRFSRPEPGDVVGDDREGTALWLPWLPTDASGLATVEVDLPPGEVEWQVRVAGVGGGLFGSATVEVPE